MKYNPMQLFFDASNCTMALNHLLSRKRFTESELQDLERLLLCGENFSPSFIYFKTIISK